MSMIPDKYRVQTTRDVVARMYADGFTPTRIKRMLTTQGLSRQAVEHHMRALEIPTTDRDHWRAKRAER